MIQVSSIWKGWLVTKFTCDPCLYEKLVNCWYPLVTGIPWWWWAWGRLSMVVGWPGDSSANLLREGISGQLRSVYPITRRHPSTPKEHLSPVVGCWLSGWNWNFSWEKWCLCGFLWSRTVSRSMSIPLAQLIRMTRFLLLCEMFEEVVVYTQKLLLSKFRSCWRQVVNMYKQLCAVMCDLIHFICCYLVNVS